MANLMDGGAVAALAAGALALWLVIRRLRDRLLLSRAKHRSLAGHARMSRRIAGLVPRYVYEGDLFFRADDAGEPLAARRRTGFDALAKTLRAGNGRTLRLTSEATPYISDLQFTESYRVPFQFSPRVRAALPAGAFVASSLGVQVTDLDGTARYDLSGSYGVNLLGYDFYKGCMSAAPGASPGLAPYSGPIRISSPTMRSVLPASPASRKCRSTCRGRKR